MNSTEFLKGDDSLINTMYVPDKEAAEGPPEERLESTLSAIDVKVLEFRGQHDLPSKIHTERKSMFKASNVLPIKRVNMMEMINESPNKLKK